MIVTRIKMDLYDNGDPFQSIFSTDAITCEIIPHSLWNYFAKESPFITQRIFKYEARYWALLPSSNCTVLRRFQINYLHV